MASLAARYQPFYCEENIHHLAADPTLAARRREVVFISNAARACAFWGQRAARRPGVPLVWDYHVVLLAHGPSEILDLDTTLGFPCPAGRYLAESFRAGTPPPYRPRFRVVPADAFLALFASDRSHMRDASGAYLRPPPPWAPLGPSGAPSNLERFIDMTPGFVGEVLDLRALAAHVGA